MEFLRLAFSETLLREYEPPVKSEKDDIDARAAERSFARAMRHDLVTMGHKGPGGAETVGGPGNEDGVPLMETVTAVGTMLTLPRRAAPSIISQDGEAIGLQVEGFRIGAAADARIEQIYRGELLGGKGEVEDVEVLGDALRLHGLGEGGKFVV
jgi:hypothetical protein